MKFLADYNELKNKSFGFMLYDEKSSLDYLTLNQAKAPEFLKKYCDIVVVDVMNFRLVAFMQHLKLYKPHISDKIYKNYEIVFIGSDKDNERLNPLIKHVEKKYVILNDIKKSVGSIIGAKFIVGNDTGMYHVASAFDKHIFVLWKDTKFEKNRSPGTNCYYSFKNNWEKGFDEFYNKMVMNG